MANSTIVYAGTEDGMFILNKPGTLPEWLPPRHVLQGKRVTSAWAEPGPPIRVLVIADGLLLYSENGGRTWEPAGPAGEMAEPVRRMRYDAASHTIEVITEEEISWISPDSGMTWQIVGTGDALPPDPIAEYGLKMPPDVFASVLIPGGTGPVPALVAGTREGLQVSADGGTTWVVTDLPHEGAVTALARDPERRDRLYAATNSGYLFESGNRGHTWQSINSAPIAPVVALYVARI